MIFCNFPRSAMSLQALDIVYFECSLKFNFSSKINPRCLACVVLITGLGNIQMYRYPDVLNSRWTCRGGSRLFLVLYYQLPLKKTRKCFWNIYTILFRNYQKSMLGCHNISRSKTNLGNQLLKKRLVFDWWIFESTIFSRHLDTTDGTHNDIAELNERYSDFIKYYFLLNVQVVCGYK